MSPLLLFDFDGVIADSQEVFYESLVTACRQHGFTPFADRAAFLNLFDGNMVDGLQGHGIPKTAIAAILRDLGDLLENAMDRYPPFPGVVEAFRRLTVVTPVYVITSNLTSVVLRYLDQYGIAGVRDVLGADREASKQVKIRQLSAQWPALEPVYVGDTLGDMKEAHAAGAIAVAVGWGWHTEERLRRGSPHEFLVSPPALQTLEIDRAEK